MKELMFSPTLIPTMMRVSTPSKLSKIVAGTPTWKPSLWQKHRCNIVPQHARNSQEKCKTIESVMLKQTMLKA
eukprot:3245144-Amphidinium_carterae.1